MFGKAHADFDVTGRGKGDFGTKIGNEAFQGQRGFHQGNSINLQEEFAPEIKKGIMTQNDNAFGKIVNILLLLLLLSCRSFVVVARFLVVGWRLHPIRHYSHVVITTTMTRIFLSFVIFTGCSTTKRLLPECPHMFDIDGIVPDLESTPVESGSVRRGETK